MDPRIIVVILCLCCCCISSSFGGAYYTGNIPGTSINFFKKSNDILVTMIDENRCEFTDDEKKFLKGPDTDFIDASFMGDDLFKYTKDNPILKDIVENYKKLHSTCEDSKKLAEGSGILGIFVIFSNLGLN